VDAYGHSNDLASARRGPVSAEDLDDRTAKLNLSMSRLPQCRGDFCFGIPPYFSRAKDAYDAQCAGRWGIWKRTQWADALKFNLIRQRLVVHDVKSQPTDYCFRLRARAIAGRHQKSHRRTLPPRQRGADNVCEIRNPKTGGWRYSAFLNMKHRKLSPYGDRKRSAFDWAPIVRLHPGNKRSRQTKSTR
jgi:hypothetical protein